jgi:hypothetical protein
MQDSHTPAPSAETAAADRDRLWLVGATALGLDERLAGRLDGHLARFAAHMREGLLAASVAVGLDVMTELMEAEVTDLAGPKGKHNPARTAKRHGSEHGTVALGGRRIGVRRPRVRTVGDHERELPVASYETFTSADLLADGRQDAGRAVDPRLPGRAGTGRRPGRADRDGHLALGGLAPVRDRDR